MARYPKPAEGSWTEHYPATRHRAGLLRGLDLAGVLRAGAGGDLQAGLAQGGAGRADPAQGRYFTKEIAAANTSIIVVPSTVRSVRAFHNVCRHRGNKLVWNDFPQEETSGTARQFVCKYHGWRYGLDGACTFAQQEGEFFDLDKVRVRPGAGALRRVRRLHLRELRRPNRASRCASSSGPMLLGVEDYPFGEMTDRYGFRVECRANWKVFSDAFMEFYHAPVVHVGQHPEPAPRRDQRGRIRGTRTTRSTAPHGLVTTAGSLHRVWEMPPENVKPADLATRSGLFGPWEQTDLGELPPGINPGKIEPWGLSSFQFFPNFAILIWEAGWYNTHQFWPTSHNTLVFEGNVYSVPAK